MPDYAIINCHFHAVQVFSDDGKTLLRTLQPGLPEVIFRWYQMPTNMVVDGTTVYDQVLEIKNMPPPREGTLYLVPIEVQRALYWQRNDLISADFKRHGIGERGVYDDPSKPRGCTGYFRLLPAQVTLYNDGRQPRQVIQTHTPEPPPPPPVDPIESEWDEIRQTKRRVADLLDFPGSHQMYLVARSGRNREVYVWYEQPDGAEGFFVVTVVDYEEVRIAPGTPPQRTVKSSKPINIAYSSPSKLIREMKKHEDDFRSWLVYVGGEAYES